MEREQLEDLHTDGRITLKYIKQIGMKGIYWIDLAQDRDKLWAVANSEMKHWVP
jgi:hypothetical protein